MMLYPFTAWSSHQISIYGKPCKFWFWKLFKEKRSSSCEDLLLAGDRGDGPAHLLLLHLHLPQRRHVDKIWWANQIYQRLSNRHCLLTDVFFMSTKYSAKDIIHLIWSHRLTKLIHIKLLLLRTVRWKSLIMLLKSQM